MNMRILQKEMRIGAKIKINSYALATYCDTIFSSVSQQELDVMADDPIFLTSVWQEGDVL